MTITIEPVEGKLVPYPDGSGRCVRERVKVTFNTYWGRRVAQGDVTKIEEP